MEPRIRPAPLRPQVPFSTVPHQRDKSPCTCINPPCYCKGLSLCSSPCRYLSYPSPTGTDRRARALHIFSPSIPSVPPRRNSLTSKRRGSDSFLLPTSFIIVRPHVFSSAPGTGRVQIGPGTLQQKDSRYPAVHLAAPGNSILLVRQSCRARPYQRETAVARLMRHALNHRSDLVVAAQGIGSSRTWTTGRRSPQMSTI